MPFRAIEGHAQVRALLARAVAQQTLPPSLLFAGPEGVGKRLTALALAETLNCLEPAPDPASGPDACGRCAACTRIARGLHPDVRILEPNERGAIPVDAVRELIDRANYRPFEGRRRVTILDDAEAMTEAAQNALLKTLEEPTASSVFVLVTARPDMLRPTVQSRCPRLRFGLLEAEDIATGLMRRHQVPEPRARALAAMAGGRFSRALGEERGDAAETRALAADLLRGLARSAAPRLRLELAQRLAGRPERPRGGGGRGSGAGGGLATEREILATRLEALGVLLRDVAATVSGTGHERLANADMRAELERLAPGYDTGRLLEAYRLVDRALAALDRNVSPKTVADWVLMQI